MFTCTRALSIALALGMAGGGFGCAAKAAPDKGAQQVSSGVPEATGRGAATDDITDNNSGKLHPAREIGLDGAYAERTANKAYRTTPLRGLWQHPPYFHDGSAATLIEVVTHYNRQRKLDLTERQQQDLVEYLKSL